MMVLYIKIYQHEIFLHRFYPETRGCIVGCIGSLCTSMFVAFWIPFGVLESIVLFLTAWKSLQSLREIRAIGGKTTVINIVMRDGILYYIGISIGMIITFHLNPFAPDLIIPVFKSLQISICSRLMLNLRGVLDTSVGSSQIMSGPQATLLDLDSFRRIEDQGRYDEDEIQYHTRLTVSRTQISAR
ncbi:hypothetical protein D9619_006768 [Psilocybe cf. subviscida]|uniref:Uncharacterized protein n=1 Tax=Psilocybe cf. subviscida TaxID=2480587 RepID=A0A8H5B4C4_9AGAR|nr:hypothetical protein D9619_006768 [Psilocybe cf. subviscida]